MALQKAIVRTDRRNRANAIRDARAAVAVQNDYANYLRGLTSDG